MNIKIAFLELASGKCPYLEWEERLDKVIQGVIRVRINRLRLGNFGDCKIIQGTAGLYELRIHAGAGYRVYFGCLNNTTVILLCAGNKNSQQRDIERAKLYWKTYKDLYRKRNRYDQN